MQSAIRLKTSAWGNPSRSPRKADQRSSEPLDLESSKLREGSPGHAEVFTVAVRSDCVKSKRFGRCKRRPAARERVVDNADSKRKRRTNDLSQKTLWFQGRVWCNLFLRATRG